MPEVPAEAFSNPFAPPEQEQTDASRKSNLSNDDFRRLLMTPRAPTVSSVAPLDVTAIPKERRVSVEKREDEKKLKKKSLYSKLKKEEEERQAEWDKKYRDRAKERRDDKEPENSEDTLPSTSTYKAVAPGLVDPSVVAERRKQAIVESKFLGGDIQHTHLVKGLDYVLLDKVRGEMHSKQRDVEDQTIQEKKKEREKAKAEVVDDLKFKSSMGKNIYRILFLSRPPVRNELFSPGRMAYVFEMDEEYSESDIPTVLIRSKADCPVQESTTLTTNDIVINKLTQILSYLRQGMRSGKKSKKKEKGLVPGPLKTVPPELKLPGADQNIFDDVGEYVLGASSSQVSSKRPKTYFDNVSGLHEPKLQGPPQSAAEVVKDISKAADKMDTLADSHDEVKKGKGMKGNFDGLDMGGHYAECYPGGLEEYDGNYDSDEDADFTKMDMGNKKGPVKRWDFENEEDYSQYQSKREALPKAAFQYGVKMAEGRKTRRYGGGAVSGKAKEKAKLDREWQQISAILDKRKGGSGREAAPSTKRSKLQ